jgi:hypothetical protein
LRKPRLGLDFVITLAMPVIGRFETLRFTGRSGNNYLVFRTAPGSFHVFAEVEAKEAARDCGSLHGGNTRAQWKQIWEQAEN